MMCPLLQPKKWTDTHGTTHEIGDCLKEECAWYDQSIEACSVFSLVKIFVAMGNVIGGIADKMPHEERFRK